MRHYFLGLAANYSRKECLAHIFAWGRENDRQELNKFLEKKYVGKAILTKNGRSALALALKAYFEPGDEIIVNGFTCYAVYEAVKAVGLTPIWVDIGKTDLNFSRTTLEKVVARATPKGIIVQNSLGNPVDIVMVEKFAKKYGLTIIEDLAHCAGMKYLDGREAGTVGAGVALSFGKDKSIDTISGGAVILRHPCKNVIQAPTLAPQFADNLRARFYPLFGAIARGLSYLRLSGPWMRMLLKFHWVEKSADNKLNLRRKIAKFEAKIALDQLKKLKKSGEGPLRDFYLVKERDELLKELKKHGYFFDGFWYEKPVSPERYYSSVHFPEDECPVATEVAKKIINLPTFYGKKDLAEARKIIEKYIEGDK